MTREQIERRLKDEEGKFAALLVQREQLAARHAREMDELTTSAVETQGVVKFLKMELAIAVASESAPALNVDVS